ncbi:MAG: hypothetical protein NTY01_05605 [Verrucomicrobia bacterium]|nr:hypothetical protein [Verrucomicrobiota bacterium]
MPRPLLRNLRSVENVLDPETVVQADIEVLNERVNYLIPDDTENAGAPTTGAHEQYESWMDKDFAVWVCTVAGTPGTWRQVGGGLGGGGSVDGGPFEN